MTALLWDNFFSIFLLLLLTVFVIVFIGGRLVFYADKLALQIGISGGLVGYILVAAVTSIPELVSTFITAADGYPALAAGNIYGSNAANIALLAMIILAARVGMQRLSRESSAGILSSLLILAIVTFFYFFSAHKGISIGKFPLAAGVFLVYLMLMFLNYTLIKKEEIPPAEKGAKGAGGFLFYSVLITGCAWILVALCTRMTQLPFPGLGKPLSEQFIGTLILAVATSVPEMVTTNSMVRKGYTDMAFGNIFGSNVFNLIIFCFAPFFAAGTLTQFFKGIPLGLMYTTLSIVLFSTMLALATLLTNKKAQQGALYGIVLLWAASLILIF